MVKHKGLFYGTLIFICIVMVGAIATSVYALWQEHRNLTVEVSLVGQTEITLEVGSAYTDAGAQAKTYNKKKPDRSAKLNVTVTGSVDTAKLGTYEITYTSQYRDRKNSAHRTVRVVDTQAPVITLTADPKYYTLPGKPYQEEGFTATDNYDGDLTASVRSEEKDGVVYYTVEDSSGNVATVQRKVVYNDLTPPKIVLKGDNKIVMQVGKTFKEPGYSAKDNVQGNMTKKVVVKGSVDIYTPGTYVLTYSVTDKYKNTATATRTVVVLPFDPAECAPSNGKVIYLTFDDGPSRHTDRLLDVLNKYSVKATFFVVNNGYYSTLTRAAKEGHTVAIHTATHRFNEVYASEKSYFADLKKMQQIIKKYTGKTSMLLRFPGGSSNTISVLYNKGIMTRLVKAVEDKGYHYFDWNVDSCDAGGARTADEVFRNVVRGVSGCQNAVVLQHDTHKFSVDAVERIIVWGLMNGYTFQPITADSPGCHHGVYN